MMNTSTSRLDNVLSPSQPYVSPLTGGGDGDMTIRPARPEDLPALLDMGRAFFRESGHEARGLIFHDESFDGTCRLLGDAGFLLVVERFGSVIGMGAIDMSTAYWNRSVRMAQEAFWYLRPEHRVGHGGRLLRELERLAASKGATLFGAVTEEGRRSKALGRLYRAAGYHMVETVYRKEL